MNRARGDAAALAWAGHGFSRPGPGAEVPRDLYRAALEDALAYTTDRDGCGECDRARLCETHAERAARAQQYQQALEQEMEADEDTDNQPVTSDGPITIGEPRTGKAAAQATQAILDAIQSGRLRAELLEDRGFSFAQATDQQAQADTAPGQDERQPADWNLHDHRADSRTGGYEPEREA